LCGKRVFTIDEEKNVDVVDIAVLLSISVLNKKLHG